SVHFRVLAGQGAQASVDAVDDEQAVLESAEMRLEVSLRGGGMDIHSKTADRHLGGVDLAEPGPPFGSNWLRPPLHAAHAAQTPAGTALTLTAPSLAFPGLTVERAVSFLSDSVLRVEYRVYNTTDHPVSTKLRMKAWSGLNGWLAFPAEGGVLREPLRG